MRKNATTREHLKPIICAIGCFILLMGLTGCTGDENIIRDYVVLVGEDSSVAKEIENIDLLVIDADYFTAEDIALLKGRNINQIYTYLNVGSIENYRSYYNDYEEFTLGEYDNWPEERWVDVSQTKWQDFIAERVEELSLKGVDGFFIDNTDVFYMYPNDSIYDGLVTILSGIKRTGKKVIINGGDSFVRTYIESGEATALFDGVNQESVYTKYEFEDATYVKNSEEDRTYLVEYLDLVKANKYSVYVLEYAKDKKIASEACSYSKDRGYICYVSNNIELVN